MLDVTACNLIKMDGNYLKVTGNAVQPHSIAKCKRENQSQAISSISSIGMPIEGNPNFCRRNKGILDDFHRIQNQIECHINARFSHCNGRPTISPPGNNPSLFIQKMQMFQKPSRPSSLEIDPRVKLPVIVKKCPKPTPHPLTVLSLRPGKEPRQVSQEAMPSLMGEEFHGRSQTNTSNRGTNRRGTKKSAITTKKSSTVQPVATRKTLPDYNLQVKTSVPERTTMQTVVSCTIPSEPVKKLPEVEVVSKKSRPVFLPKFWTEKPVEVTEDYNQELKQKAIELPETSWLPNKRDAKLPITYARPPKKRDDHHGKHLDVYGKGCVIHIPEGHWNHLSKEGTFDPQIVKWHVYRIFLRQCKDMAANTSTVATCVPSVDSLRTRTAGTGSPTTTPMKPVNPIAVFSAAILIMTDEISGDRTNTPALNSILALNKEQPADPKFYKAKCSLSNFIREYLQVFKKRIVYWAESYENVFQYGNELKKSMAVDALLRDLVDLDVQVMKDGECGVLQADIEGTPDDDRHVLTYLRNFSGDIEEQDKYVVDSYVGRRLQHSVKKVEKWLDKFGRRIKVESLAASEAATEHRKEQTAGYEDGYECKEIVVIDVDNYSENEREEICKRMNVAGVAVMSPTNVQTQCYLRTGMSCPTVNMVKPKKVIDIMQEKPLTDQPKKVIDIMQEKPLTDQPKKVIDIMQEKPLADDQPKKETTSSPVKVRKKILRNSSPARVKKSAHNMVEDLVRQLMADWHSSNSDQFEPLEICTGSATDEPVWDDESVIQSSEMCPAVELGKKKVMAWLSNHDMQMMQPPPYLSQEYEDSDFSFWAYPRNRKKQQTTLAKCEKR